MNYKVEKESFRNALKVFANSLGQYIAQNDEWTIKGFIDVFKNVEKTIGYFYVNPLKKQ